MFEKHSSFNYKLETYIPTSNIWLDYDFFFLVLAY